MSSAGQIVFLVNLVQDVNIVRPLALLAATQLGIRVDFLISDRFLVRDGTGQWRDELKQLSMDIGARRQVYDCEHRALQFLQGRCGLLIAASESNLSAHAHTHNVMRIAPPGFIKVTLQHGFECVGFLQSREHDKAHGTRVAFAADVLCGWCELSSMRSMMASERSKFYLTGPTALLYEPKARHLDAARQGGLVCENLHSSRMSASGDFKASYMETFSAFCDQLANEGQQVTLRPHPGGQYVLKNDVPLPPNVSLNNHPMYKVDLTQYAYGISAPSSVIIDMVLAGIPVAVWQDEDEVIDASCYEGLTTISGIDDWLAFAKDAEKRPQMFLDPQQRFLERSGLLIDREQVRRKFSALLGQSLSMRAEDHAAAERVLFVANSIIPTLQLSFLKPLAVAQDSGEMVLQTLVDDDIQALFGDARKGPLSPEAQSRAESWIRQRVDEFAPTLLVVCRYSGPFARLVTEIAHEKAIPVIYHIDDDLLNVPRELGRAKYLFHNDPRRTGSVRHLLENADLVYCSTTPLLERFRSFGFRTPMTCGEVYCTAEVMRPAVQRPVRKIGYMGFDHAHDLEMILPAVVSALRSHPELTFDLFGSIPKPAALDEFGGRVVVIEPVRVYTEFLDKFASLDWDIGLCPLVVSPFNSVKANTKWVEYTAVGAAVIASRGMAYDVCASNGCGILAESLQDWVHAIDSLCRDSQQRYEMVRSAQQRLRQEYSDEKLREQIRGVFRQAHDMRAEIPRTAEAASLEYAGVNG